MVFHFDRKMSSKCFLIKFRHIFYPIVHLYHVAGHVHALRMVMCMRIVASVTCITVYKAMMRCDWLPDLAILWWPLLHYSPYFRMECVQCGCVCVLCWSCSATCGTNADLLQSISIKSNGLCQIACLMHYVVGVEGMDCSVVFRQTNEHNAQQRHYHAHRSYTIFMYIAMA